MRTSLLSCTILLWAGASAQFGSKKKAPQEQNGLAGGWDAWLQHFLCPQYVNFQHSPSLHEITYLLWLTFALFFFLCIPGQGLMFVEVAAYDTSDRIGGMVACTEAKPLEGAKHVKVFHGLLSLMPTCNARNSYCRCIIGSGCSKWFYWFKQMSQNPKSICLIWRHESSQPSKVEWVHCCTSRHCRQCGSNPLLHGPCCVQQEKGKIFMPATPLGMVWVVLWSLTVWVTMGILLFFMISLKIAWYLSSLQQDV
jgi:hypothetical protein